MIISFRISTCSNFKLTKMWEWTKLLNKHSDKLPKVRLRGKIIVLNILGLGALFKNSRNRRKLLMRRFPEILLKKVRLRLIQGSNFRKLNNSRLLLSPTRIRLNANTSTQWSESKLETLYQTQYCWRNTTTWTND